MSNGAENHQISKKNKTMPEPPWFPLPLPGQLGLQAWVSKACRAGCEQAALGHQGLSGTKLGLQTRKNNGDLGQAGVSAVGPAPKR